MKNKNFWLTLGVVAAIYYVWKTKSNAEAPLPNVPLMNSGRWAPYPSIISPAGAAAYLTANGANTVRASDVYPSMWDSPVWDAAMAETLKLQPDSFALTVNQYMNG